MSKFRFVRKNGKILGPLTADRIDSLFSEGKLAAEDELGENKEGPWQSVATLKERIERAQKRRAEADKLRASRHSNASDLPAIPAGDESAHNVETLTRSNPTDDLFSQPGVPDMPSFDVQLESPTSTFVPGVAPTETTPKTAAATRHSSDAATAAKPALTRNHVQMIILLLSLLLAAQVFGFSKTKDVTTKWEYTLEAPSDTSFESSLDNMGSQGWELVTARRATSSYGGASYEMIFKRPK